MSWEVSHRRWVGWTRFSSLQDYDFPAFSTSIAWYGVQADLSALWRFSGGQRIHFQAIRLLYGNMVTKSVHPPRQRCQVRSSPADFVASIAGAVASITVAAPLDVVKTRIQNAHFESKEGGMAIIRNMVKQEGVGSFFKGLTPKVSSHGFSRGRVRWEQPESSL